MVTLALALIPYWLLLLFLLILLLLLLAIWLYFYLGSALQVTSNRYTNPDGVKSMADSLSLITFVLFRLNCYH